MKDNQHLKSAKGRSGHPIPTYDDGYGPLFILRDSMGIQGIVRARTWADAWSIAEDEFFPAGDENAHEEMDRIEDMPDGPEKDHAQACFDEAYGFRGNSRAMPDGTESSIYAKDLNGEALDVLTPELIAKLEISLEIETDPEEPQE